MYPVTSAYINVIQYKDQDNRWEEPHVQHPDQLLLCDKSARGLQEFAVRIVYVDTVRCLLSIVDRRSILDVDLVFKQNGRFFDPVLGG